MRRKINLLFILFLVSAGVVVSDTGDTDWGFWAHKRINRIAVFTLPPEMTGFYKKHIDWITEHAVDPDKRRYAVEDEAPRHYIDIDHYGEYPFDTVPRSWDSAVKVLTEDTLQAYGILPWHCHLMMYRLQKAFEEKNTYRILRLSAELGHYIGDAHVPLHTTLNYNGQLTDQRGIHGFWESRIPELMGDDYDYFVGKAEYIDDYHQEIWDIVLSSHLAVDSVLGFERELDKKFSPDQKYSYEKRGQTTVRTYSRAYSEAYAKMLDGMIERRMRYAIINLGSLWMTAWVNAGQPDLDDLDLYHPTEEDLEAEKLLDKLFKNNKIKGRDHQH